MLQVMGVINAGNLGAKRLLARKMNKIRAKLLHGSIRIPDFYNMRSEQVAIAIQHLSYWFHLHQLLFPVDLMWNSYNFV